MNRSLKLPLASALAFGLILAACGADTADGPATTGGPDTSIGADLVNSDAANEAGLDGDWILTEGTVADVWLALDPAFPITMTVDGAQIQGRAACNGYGGSLSADDGSFLVGSMSWTEMACQPEAMTLESQFIDGLGRADSAKLEAAALVVTGDGVQFAFELAEPVPTAELIGTAWLLDTIFDNGAASSTVLGAEPATLLFAADGTFAGSTGCRTISGEYVVTGATVQLTSWGADGQCDEALASQDASVISVLEAGFSAQIDGGQLTLGSADGAGLGYRSQ